MPSKNRRRGRRWPPYGGPVRAVLRPAEPVFVELERLFRPAHMSGLRMRTLVRVRGGVGRPDGVGIWRPPRATRFAAGRRSTYRLMLVVRLRVTCSLARQVTRGCWVFVTARKACHFQGGPPQKKNVSSVTAPGHFFRLVVGWRPRTFRPNRRSKVLRPRRPEKLFNSGSPER